MKRAVKKVFVKLLLFSALMMLLALLAFVVWRVRLANDISRQLAAIHAAALPINGEEANTYYTAVPDDKNAAVKMAEAFAVITNYSDSRSKAIIAFKFPTRKSDLSAEQLDLLGGYCAMNSDTLSLAEEAANMPDSRYPIDLSWGASTQLPHLKPLKELALIAAYQSVLEPTNSAMHISAVVGMAHTLDTEPVLISKLVRIALLNIAASALEHRLNRGPLDDGDLDRLEKTFADAAKTNQTVNGFIGERAMCIPYFRMSWADIKKFSSSDDENSSNQDPGGPPQPGPRPLINVVTGFFERDLRYYLQAMQTNIYFASIYPKNVLLISNVQDQIEQTSKRNFYIFSSLLLPSLRNMVIKDANNLALIRSAQAALAIERFRQAQGKLPERLDKLCPQYLTAVPSDPYDENPIRYKRLEQGYVVYSIGPDGEDNGGRERPPDAKRNDKTPYDITFTVER